MGQVFCCVKVNMSTVNIKDKGMGQLFCFVDVDHSKFSIKENIVESKEVMNESGRCCCLSWIFRSKIDGLQQMDVRCDTKTKDDVYVDVVANVQYRALANKANNASSDPSNTRNQIQAYVSDVIKARVPKLSLDEAIEQKNEIAKAMEEELKISVSAYGCEIVQALIIDIDPNYEHVKPPMDEVNSGLKMTSNVKVETEKTLHIKPAEGEAESRYLSVISVGR